MASPLWCSKCLTLVIVFAFGLFSSRLFPEPDGLQRVDTIDAVSVAATANLGLRTGHAQSTQAPVVAHGGPPPPPPSASAQLDAGFGLPLKPDDPAKRKKLPVPGRNELVFDIGPADGGTAETYRRVWGVDVLMLEAGTHWCKAYLQPKLHQREGYWLVNAAASDEDGRTITFFAACSGYISSARKEWLADSKMRYGNDKCVRKTEVKTRTMDSLIAEFGMPAYLKIDIEGYEETGLKGLTVRVPLLAWEWTYPETLPDAVRMLKRMWNEVGMRAWAIFYGDTPFEAFPAEKEFRCLNTVTEELLANLMKAMPSKMIKEGPVGMLFVAAEVPRGAKVTGRCDPPESAGKRKQTALPARRNWNELEASKTAPRCDVAQGTDDRGAPMEDTMVIFQHTDDKQDLQLSCCRLCRDTEGCQVGVLAGHACYLKGECDTGEGKCGYPKKEAVRLAVRRE